MEMVGGDISPFPEQLEIEDTNDTRYLTLSRHYSHKLLTIEIVFLFSQPNIEHGRYLHEGKMLSYGK